VGGGVDVPAGTDHVAFTVLPAPTLMARTGSLLARWTSRRLLPDSRKVSYSQPSRGAQADDVTDAFADAATVRAGLAAQGYLADDKIAGVVSLAALLGKPLLIEGPAETGKTQLAKSAAQLAARPRSAPNWSAAARSSSSGTHAGTTFRRRRRRWPG
jgi:hypothetical protein